MTHSLSTVVLDLFDTVVQVDHQRLRREMAQSIGIDEDAFLNAYEVTRVVRNTGELQSARADLEAVLGATGIVDRSITDRLLGLELDFYATEGEIYADAVLFVQELRVRNIPSAIVSNCARGVTTLIQRLSVRQLCDTTVLSFEVGSRKPDPRIYQIVLDRLDVEPEEILYIDDNAEFCAAARGVGMHALRLNRTETGKMDIQEISTLRSEVIDKWMSRVQG